MAQNQMAYTTYIYKGEVDGPEPDGVHNLFNIPHL